MSTNSDNSPYATPSEDHRNPMQAQSLSMKGADLIDKDPKKAEELFRQSLTYDIYYGPAHNNLGVIYLKQGKLYEAANEFEWARKLMPGSPDPRLNLAMTLEKAGHIDEAMAACRSALEVYPNHIQTTEFLASMELRYGHADTTTSDLLKDIALRGETPKWREWARAQSAIQGQ